MIIKQRIQKADGSIRFRNYLRQQKLGKGGFAQCFTVERMQDKKLFALKIINKKNLQKPKAKQKMLSQINLHKSVKHKYICQLDRVFQDEQNVYMLLQLCIHGNMFDLIKKRKRLTIPQTQYYIYQLVDGLCYLHNRQIIHRDIKLGNLLINGKMQLKLADFGLATKLQFFGDRKHTVCGTPNYIAPQVILSSMNLGISGHSYEVDIWSTGVIMYLMLVGKAPFQTNKIQMTYEKIARAQFDFPDSFKDNSAKDLLRKIMVVDVAKRYTFQQVLAHQFMNPKHGIPKEIPTTSMIVAPRFQHKFQKFQSSDVKQSARNFSINTLQSEMDLSLDQNLEGLPYGSNPDKNKSKDIKGLLKTVFSTSSLSRSLEKLAVIGRSTSMRAKELREEHRSNQNGNDKISLRDRAISSSTIGVSNIINRQPQNHSFILTFKKDVLFSYMMNTGYIGTYQPNYKLLFHKNKGLYFEAEGETELRRIKNQNTYGNDHIQNRRKFIKLYTENILECQPFFNTSRIVYLTRTFQVKTQNVILFKFSNSHIQIHHFNSDKNLLVTQQQLVLISIQNGVEVSRCVERKEKYLDSVNKDLISLYLKFKKINNQITNSSRSKK